MIKSHVKSAEGIKTIWLSISIFSAKKDWNLVLKYLVQPVATKQIEGVISCHISLNYYCGENVRLAIQTQEKDAVAVSARVELLAHSFFANHSLSEIKATLPVDGIFMPFPANSIRFGLFPIAFDEQPKVYIDIGSTLSQMLAEILADESINEEILLTAGFYLQTILIETWNYRKSRLCNLLERAFNTAFINEQTTIEISCIREKFSENEKILRDIYDSITNAKADKYSELPTWVRFWAEVCERSIQGIDTNNKTETEFYVFFDIISGQLGMSFNMQSLLTFFLWRTVSTVN